MAKLPDFDPTQHEAAVAYELLPNGWYAMQINASEMTPTAACERGECKAYYWKFELMPSEAHHPAHKHIKVWERLNLINPNQQAVDISNRTLAAMCKAQGLTTVVTDTEVLHGTVMAVKIGTQPAKGEYEASNVVKGYAPLADHQHELMGGGGQVAAAPAQQAAPPIAPVAAPPQAGGPAPWEEV